MNMILLLCFTLCSASIIVAELHTEDEAEARAFAREHSLELLSKETEHLPKKFWAFRAEKHRTREVAARLDDSPNVIWHEVQEKRRRYTREENEKRSTTGAFGAEQSSKRDSFLRRGAPLLGNPKQARSGASDPLYASQWHLHGNANSLNVESAWQQGITGKGVTVAIVDDGVQVSHPDLRVNRELSHDFNSNRGTDPSPYATDGHGTSAAGVCCALRNNGQCGSGVAPESTLVGLRLIAEPTTDLQESTALSFKYEHDIDIYSNSWGPMDDAADLQSPGRLTQMIFKRNTREGRDGKGSIYVWAGGNGRENQDNCNYDGYANSIYTIAVGAIDHLGYQSWYSEPCSALLVVGPSSGSHLGITTTDLTGYNGYAAGQCCSSFGGTSSAAPAVAGAIALLLQKRPDLTWRDVQHVLAKSAVMPVRATQRMQSELSSNERGYVHSERFGFGRVDVQSMLTVVEDYTLAPAKKALVLSIAERDPHNGNARPKATGTFNMQGDLSFVEHVTLSLSVRHRRRANLKISLVAPSGVVSTLFAPHSADRYANIPAEHTFMSVRHWGDTLQSTQKWSVTVEDLTRNVFYGSGYLQEATLTIHGY